MDERPIGVFDSGLGGLTGLRELHRLLPGENLIYFGDTGRVPYGTRSRETILKYAEQDARLLLRHDVKAVLSACGTVSSVAGETLRKILPCPYYEIITPAAKAACAVSRKGKIGVIATPATINSGRFQAAIEENWPGADVLAKSCPLFVPLVENGHYLPDDPIVIPTVELYLRPFREWGAETLILGCTHYPLLMDAIRNYLGPGVRLINSGAESALALKEELERKNLLASRETGEYSFYVTDTVRGFSKVAEPFLGEPVTKNAEQVSLEWMEQIGEEEYP